MDNRPYTPGDSTATRPSAVATTHHPADETYSNPNSSGFFLARAARDRKTLIHLLIELALVMAVIGLIAIPKLQSAVNADQATYARTQYTGWVGHSTTGQPVSITILPCQHLPCLNITIDLTVPHVPTKADPSTTTTYTLGGQYLGGNEVYVSGRYGGVDIIADITTTSPVNGVITSGYAQLILTQGKLQTVYQLHSATVTEQHTIFGA